MAKIKVQAQHLKAGDIVGSGEKVIRTYILTDRYSKDKIGVLLEHISSHSLVSRCVHWGKYTQITVERADAG